MLPGNSANLKEARRLLIGDWLPLWQVLEGPPFSVITPGGGPYVDVFQKRDVEITIFLPSEKVLVNIPKSLWEILA